MNSHTFSEEELDTIRKNPITDALSLIRKEFSELIGDASDLINLAPSDPKVSWFYIYMIITLAKSHMNVKILIIM